MKKLKKEEDRRIRFSISMNPELYNILEDRTTNKSRYIEFVLLDFFNKYDIDVSKIKL